MATKVAAPVKPEDKEVSVSKSPSVAIEIPQIQLGIMELKLVGDSMLVTHKWSNKAKKQMLDKQMKVAATGKEAKNPEQDYLDSMYVLEDGSYGFPTVGFKAAAVSACRFAEIKMTQARGAFHVLGEHAKIEGEPEMREDMVRVGMGTADIRYRAMFNPWSTTLTVRYNKQALSPAQIVNLFNLAGFGVGVGEFRPEKNGSWGMFHVATDGE